MTTYQFDTLASEVLQRLEDYGRDKQTLKSAALAIRQNLREALQCPPDVITTGWGLQYDEFKGDVPVTDGVARALYQVTLHSTEQLSLVAEVQFTITKDGKARFGILDLSGAVNWHDTPQPITQFIVNELSTFGTERLFLPKSVSPTGVRLYRAKDALR